MINVLLVIRSYFDALHVASLLDWEANGYQLIMEMNAISGLRHLSDLRPDILLLHHDVGWLDADKYLSHIRSAYLPTQIIMLLGKRGGAARNKRQIALAKEIQVIEWEKLSAELLKNALHTANLYAVKTEEHNVAFEQKRFVKEATAEEQLAALQRSVLPDQMSLIRLVVAKKMQPHSTQEQIERAIETILASLQYGYQFRDNTGDYCLLVKVEDDFLRYNRTAYLNDLAQRLLQSVKETLHTEAYVSICYQAASSALMEEMAMLRRLERYHYFRPELQIISVLNLQIPEEAEQAFLMPALWAVWSGLVQQDIRRTVDLLQNLFLHELKQAMSFTLLSAVRSALWEMEQFLAPERLAAEQKNPAEAESHDIAEEFALWSGLFEALTEARRTETEAWSATVRAVDQTVLLQFPQQISMNGLAEQCGVTPAYLSRIYKMQMGCGWSERLRAVRLRAARTFMACGASNIQWISENVGYEDPKYFARIFRSEYAQSPTAYLRERNGPVQECTSTAEEGTGYAKR